jgi:hypothetical protein
MLLSTTVAISLVQLEAVADHADDSAAFAHLPLEYQGPDPTAGYYLAPGPYPVTDTQPPIDGLPADRPPRAILAETPLDVVDPLYDLPPPAAGLVDPLVLRGRRVTDHKEGFFQKASVVLTWLDRRSSEGFGITEVDLYAVFAVPAPHRDWPLLITPAFDVRWLDGPQAPDLPPRLYETFLDFMWLPRLSERWMGILSIAPSYYGDFEVDTSEAWRLTGKGLARFDWFPDRLQLLFGVLYLNRQDVRLLPAGGLIWTPREDRRYEIVFPRPKLAHRIDWGERFEDWLYLGSEFGGNSYAFFDGTVTDIVTLRDYRIYIGLERKLDGGAGFRLEVGYVLSRTAEFVSGLPDVKAKDTAHIRVGATF